MNMEKRRIGGPDGDSGGPQIQAESHGSDRPGVDRPQRDLGDEPKQHSVQPDPEEPLAGYVDDVGVPHPLL